MAKLPDLTQPSKIKIHIHENSWLAKISARKLKEASIALTVGRHIFLYQVSKSDFLRDAPWVAHELAHVRQFIKYGRIRFIALYLWESLRKGYYLNHWEIEARRQSEDLTILDGFYFV